MIDQKNEVSDYDEYQGFIHTKFATKEQIDNIVRICDEKGLNLPRNDMHIPYFALTFRDLSNTDYTVAQYHRDIELANAILSSCDKWPYGYFVPKTFKNVFWWVKQKFYISNDMLKLFTDGYYMDPVERYAVQLAYQIKHEKDINDDDMIALYNSKSKVDLMQMHQREEIFLMHSPVHKVEFF